MSAKRRKKKKSFRQPYIVVWWTWREQDVQASHEGACAPSEAKALRQARDLLEEWEYAVAAYNEGQCARIRDTLVRLKRTAPRGLAPFVVFYDPVNTAYRTYSRLDRVCELWIALLARDWKEAIEIAQQRLEPGFIPFLSYGLSDMEEIRVAVADSWP